MSPDECPEGAQREGVFADPMGLQGQKVPAELLGKGSPGHAEASLLPLQRLAYGITPENEYHLVAERDVRQFQVGAAWSRARGGVGPSCPLLCRCRRTL